MKLPPMNALRAFEAVSRHGSVSRAADELCVSQGAVSQQLRNLEDHLGRELFVRSANKISLSQAGEDFARVVQQALAEIAAAAAAVSRARGSQTLTISMWKGFAVKWLMPRLGEFYEKCPQITVIIDESDRLATFDNDGVDGAIRFCNGDDDGLDNRFLFHPRMYAVASPAYIEKHGRLESLAEPGAHHLVDHQYASREIRSQHVHWEDVVADGQPGQGRPLAIFPDAHQAFNAALQGKGIALAPKHMFEDELVAGSIEIVNAESIPARFKYFFVSPRLARPNPALTAFRDWLIEKFAVYRAPVAGAEDRAAR